MKNYKIAIIFVLGVWLTIGDVDLVDADSQIEIKEYRAPGGKDIIGYLSKIPFFKPFIPFIQKVPVMIGNFLKTTITDPLFPQLEKLADKASGFSIPLFSKLPLQMQEKLAALQIQPLFNSLLFLPPISFVAPIFQPISVAVEPLISVMIRLMISFSGKFLLHITTGN